MKTLLIAATCGLMVLATASRVELKGSNHLTEVGTPDQQLTAPSLQWIKVLPGKS
jgi:hypothetical protein